MVETLTQELIWSQPDPFSRAYELHAGRALLATLRWQKAWGSSLAVAHAANGTWLFKRDGLWHPRVLLCDAVSGVELGMFRTGHAGGGTLDLADGRRYHWTNTGVWQSAWYWEDADKRPLLRFKSTQRLRTAEAHLVIDPSAAGRPEIPLLASLGWYLLLLLAWENTATTVSS